jgi:hypothetical protein
MQVNLQRILVILTFAGCRHACPEGVPQQYQQQLFIDKGILLIIPHHLQHPPQRWLSICLYQQAKDNRPDNAHKMLSSAPVITDPTDTSLTEEQASGMPISEA